MLYLYKNSNSVTSDCVVELDDDVTALTQAKSSECDSVMGTTEVRKICVSIIMYAMMIQKIT